MKNRAFKLTTTLLLSLTLAVAVTVGGAFCTADVTVAVDETTRLAAHGDFFAYNEGAALVVVKGGRTTFSKDNAVVGNLISISMNSSYVLLLCESGGQKSLTAYPYSSTGIGDAIDAANKIPDLTQYLSSYEDTFSDGTDFYLIRNFNVQCLNLNDAMTLSSFIFSEKSLFGEADDFAVSGSDRNKRLYLSKNNALYIFEGDYPGTTLPAPALTSSASIRLAATSKGVYASSAEKILFINGDGQADALESAPPVDALCAATDARVFLLDKSHGAIYQYSAAEDGKLTYDNKFDSTLFAHPTKFDILTAYKVLFATPIIASPRNMAIVATAEAGDYVLVLAASEDEYMYVADKSGATGYVKKPALERVDVSSDSPFGVQAQALHPDTKLYKYPFDGAETVTTLSIETPLSVLSDCGNVSGREIWGWYKVACVNDDGATLHGYVKSVNLCAYTALTPPSIEQEAVIKADKLGGVVKIYTLPDSTSAVIATLTDGAKVSLPAKPDKDSAWTRVVYDGKVGYVPTSRLANKGLTPLQITMIVVGCVAAVCAAAAATILIVRKRHENSVG